MPTLAIDGRKIHYRDTGGRHTPLLLLHAFPFDGRMWEAQLEGLRDRYRIIAPDLSGFGLSSCPEDPAGYSVERWAEEAKAVLDHCGVERAVVGGCSLGGYVAFAFQRRFPERLRGLLLADTRAEPDSEQARQGRKASQEEVRERGKAPLLERMRALLLAPASAADEALVARVRVLMDQTEAGIVGALEALANRPDSTPGLASIDQPTLVVVGAQDAITPPSVAEAMQRAIPGARLVVLPGAGHLANLEAVEAFNRELASAF